VVRGEAAGRRRRAIAAAEAACGPPLSHDRSGALSPHEHSGSAAGADDAEGSSGVSGAAAAKRPRIGAASTDGAAAPGLAEQLPAVAFLAHARSAGKREVTRKPR
jgi:hypothetical protein